MVECFCLTFCGPLHYWYVKYIFAYDGLVWFDYFSEGRMIGMPNLWIET